MTFLVEFDLPQWLSDGLPALFGSQRISFPGIAILVGAAVALAAAEILLRLLPSLSGTRQVDPHGPDGPPDGKAATLDGKWTTASPARAAEHERSAV